MNTLLIGARASGKTTVARLLAQRLDRALVDLDERVLSTFCEHSIREVWTRRGEQAWRDAELRCLRQILRSDHQIIALGGGTPVIPEALALLREGRERGSIAIVYLWCDSAELVRRLMNEPGDRPPLASSLAHEIERVLAARERTYRELATVEIDTTKKQPSQVADDLVQHLSGSTTP